MTIIVPAPAGSADAAPALNTAIAQALAATDCRIELEAGNYYCHSGIVVPGGVSIEGMGKNQTALHARFSGGNLLTLTGAQGTCARLKRFACLTVAGFSPGYAVALSGNATLQPDETILEELYITNDDVGSWYGGILLDGLARVGSSAVPQGLRDVVIEHCEIFGTTSASLYTRNVVGLKMIGGGCFASSDTPASGCGIYVTGGGAPNTNSSLTDFVAVSNNGVLDITNSLGGSYHGGEADHIATDGSPGWSIRTRCPNAAANTINLTSPDLGLW